MNRRDEEILLTVDGLGVPAKRAALERITAATRAGALREAARLACIHCEKGTERTRSDDGDHWHWEGGTVRSWWCPASRIWEALSSSVGVGEKKDPTP